MLIKNCKILDGNKLVLRHILIRNGKIANITAKPPKSKEFIDAKENLVMPGLIDCHVHFREPGATRKEDFLTGSMAAAKGGVTTILDMPNTEPPTTTMQRLEEKRKLAEKSIVNYGFNFGASLDNISEVSKVKNIAAVKLYMDATTGDFKIDDFDYIVELLKTSKLTIIHAEDLSVKIVLLLFTKNKLRSRIHFAHVSNKRELEFATDKKLRKYATIEVTPHHLFMTREDIKRLGSCAEMKPRLGTHEDQAALWHGIHTGKVDIIATDHAPHLIEEKKKVNYPFGVPGLETMLPLLLDAFHQRKIDLPTIQKLCCENPAKIFRIKNKGYIKKGYDADLVIVDLNKKQKVRDEDMLTKCKWTPFDGKTLKGWPITTIVNGNVVYHKGRTFNIKAKELQYSN